MVWNSFDAVDLLIFILALTMLSYTLVMIIKVPNKWIIVFPLTFWAFHLAFFYGVILATDIIGRPLTDDAELIWSTIQRMHGVITMFYMAWLMANSTLKCEKKDNG